MPRRNHAPRSTKRPQAIQPEAKKVRYKTKSDADRQIREIQKYKPELTLTSYQSTTDNGWYLTSR